MITVYSGRAGSNVVTVQHFPSEPVVSREERKRMRVECSMLHRQANQLQDMPDPASKLKAREILLEAAMLQEIMRRSK